MISTESVRVLAGLLCLLLWPAHAVAQQGDWERHTRAGAYAYRQGNYAEAFKQTKAALSAAEAFGPNDPRLATTLNNLGVIYDTQGKHAEAEPLYKRALAIREKALGPEHPDVASVLESYAALLRKTKRSGEATMMKLRAKAIRAGR